MIYGLLRAAVFISEVVIRTEYLMAISVLTGQNETGTYL